MSDPTPGPISDDLTQLLTDWIETDTWDESQVILRANADRLLSDEALAALNELLAESAEDEDATRILLTHKAILEAARAESIDAAYAELLEESPLELALKALPDELRDALEAMIAAENATKLLEQIAQHPILLTPQAMAAIEHVMDELRQAGQEPIVRGIQERFNTVRQVQAASRPIDEELAQLLIDWINADTWEQSRELLKAHAERLLSDEALETLARLLLLEVGEDEEGENKDSRKKTLLQHQALLELARTESIDIAYDTLLRPSPLAVAMQAIPHELRDALQAMIAVESPAELLEQMRQYPILLTTQAATAIDTLLDELRQANREDTVDFINERYDTLKRMSESARDPLNVAINALLRADNPYELQQTIAQHPLLLGDAAMKALEEIITRTEQNGDAVLAQRLRFRLDEVRRIRKQREQAARNGRPALVNDDLERGHVEISAERNSIAVGRSEGSITQTNINIENLTLPPKKWQTPKRQSLPKAFVGREKELQDVHDYLVAGEAVAITGRATATMLQGMAGIGKTYLAVKLSMDLQAHFPGGVIRVNLGPEVTSEERAQVKLRELADYAFEGNLLQVAGQLRPEQVAAWLQEMAPGRLLVIFDDVWRQEPLLFLERALPADAVRIVTTRDANIAQALAGKRIPLDRMTDEDGVALLEDRLGCEGNAAYRADLEALVKLLRGHALALDIAAARIKSPRRIRTILDDLKKGVGQATLDRLKLPRGETRETNLEKSLALSYEQMTGEEKNRFRALGVFAVETPITIEAVTAIWGMEELADAQNALYDLVDLALLEEFEDAMGTSYRQHNLLHVYAYALLDKEGELNSASWAHAEYYKSMALRAETATPKDYALLDRHLQDLQAALRWADKYEPRLFAQLVEVLSQFLQLRGQFELLEVYLPRAIAAATATEDKGRQANVLQSLGDLEGRLGNPDQARAQYDAALPLFQAERARLGEANVLQSLGDLERRLGNVDQARAHYDAALPLFQAERARLGEANVLRSLGDLERRLGNVDQARAHYDAALPLYQAERDRLGEANVLQSLGDLEGRLGNLDQARAQYDAALPLFQAERARLGEANVLQSLGDLERRLGNLDQARAQYDAALPLFQAERARLGEANVLQSLGDLEERLGNLDQARAQYDAALPLFQAERARLGEANVLQSLGDLERRLGNLDQARAQYDAALPLFQAERARLGEANVLQSLGDLEERLGNLDQARAQYDAALPLFQAERARLGEANVLQSLGDLERRLGNLDQARAQYDAALPLFQAVRDRLGEANVLRSLGDLEGRLGNVDQARAHYDAALPLYQAERDRLGEANVLKSLGDLEGRLGNPDQARAHYDAALPLYQAERDRLGEANVYKRFAEVFLEQKEWAQARTYYERALPMYIDEREPLGIAGTLIGLGQARFELGEHKQGMQDIQRAAELYHSVQDKEWAGRAERYLAEMRARLGLSVAGSEHSLSQDNELVQAFIGAESVQAMLQLVQQHPELLTDEWFIVVEELIAAQTEESAKQALRERLDTLKQFRHDIELQGAINPEIVSLLDEFARADWPKRRQLLMEHADILLSENIEPVFDELLKVSTDPDVFEALGHLRVLLRRCRAWGIEPTEYFESGMRLGDSIEIPSEYELDVQHIATLLSEQRDDPSVHERAIEAMQTLVNGLPPATPELFRGALLRDLADTMGVLPEKHPQRKLEQMEAYYREALPLYQAADRPISVAYIQRSLGDVLSEQGRYNEALAPLQAASLGLQTYEHIRDDAAWAFSSYGSVLDNLGQIEEALAAYTEAMKLLPESAPLLRNRAETLIHARRLEEAEADLARAVGLDGNEDSPYLWYRRAQIAVARGEGSLVDQMLDEVMKRDASFDVAFLQAQSAWLHGDIKAALEGLQNTLEKANEGDRASMRREMERLFVEHPELDGRAELQDILMKFVV